MRLSRDGKTFALLRRQRNRLISRSKRLRGVDGSAYVHQSAQVSRDLEAAEYVFIAPGCQIDPGVAIGRYSMLASHVAIVGDDHVSNVPGIPMQFAGRPPQSRTTIGEDVWVGYRAILRRGVTIGRGAIVAAHAVVTADVEPYDIVAGIPARKIGTRFSSSDDRDRHDRMIDGPVLRPSFAPRLSSDSHE